MRKTMTFRGFIILLVLMLAVFLTLHLILQNRQREGSQQEAILQEALSRLEDEDRNLTAQLKVVGTDDYIVSSAIRDYAYVNRNDIRFEYTNPEALYAYTEGEIAILMDELGR